MPCWYSSTLCVCSHRAAPVNCSRSQNAAIARYWYHALNSELICTLIARSTSECIDSVLPRQTRRQTTPDTAHRPAHRSPTKPCNRNREYGSITVSFEAGDRQGDHDRTEHDK